MSSGDGFAPQNMTYPISVNYPITGLLSNGTGWTQMKPPSAWSEPQAADFTRLPKPHAVLADRAASRPCTICAGDLEIARQSSPTNGLVTTEPDAWHCRVSARPGWSGVSILFPCMVDLPLVCQCGSTSNCPSWSVREVHVAGVGGGPCGCGWWRSMWLWLVEVHVACGWGWWRSMWLWLVEVHVGVGGGPFG